MLLKMTMWIPLSLVVLMWTAMGEADEQCLCSQVRHRQEVLCNADFAYRVRIHNAGFTTAPGEPYERMHFYPYWKYEVEILETFKAAPHLQSLRKGGMAEFFTPMTSLCGLMALYDNGLDDYLFTGYVKQGKNEYNYMAITICTWVELWSDLTREQKKGLKGSYNNCNCTIYPTSGRLLHGNSPQDKFRLEECLFNPISANVLSVPDCEQLHGFCKMNEAANTCSWEYKGAYRNCFQSRQQKLSQNGKPAVMSKEGCAIYTGRKKKQCLLKFIRSRLRVG